MDEERKEIKMKDRKERIDMKMQYEREKWLRDEVEVENPIIEVPIEDVINRQRDDIIKRRLKKKQRIEETEKWVKETEKC